MWQLSITLLNLILSFNPCLCQPAPPSKKPPFCFVKRMALSLFSNLIDLLGKSVRVKCLSIKTLVGGGVVMERKFTGRQS